MSSDARVRLVVRTAAVAGSDQWAWEIVDGSTGQVVENSWTSRWAGYDDRDEAMSAGTARATELERDGDVDRAPDEDAAQPAAGPLPQPRLTLFAPPVPAFDPDERAILFLACGEHVLGCEKCRRTYRLRWIPRPEPDRYTCPLCGFDMTPAVVRHTETCWYWTTRRSVRKPLAKIDRPEPPAESAVGS